MSGIKTYEYIWLDGYKPEPFMRSKVKATSEDTAPDWSFDCLLYTSPSPRDLDLSRMPSSA